MSTLRAQRRLAVVLRRACAHVPGSRHQDLPCVRGVPKVTVSEAKLVPRLVADGGYLSGAGGAGIVLVDDHDHVIATRAVAFAATSAFEAEARAVWLASRMAEERGLGELPVYNDNLAAIPWARSIGIDARELPFLPGAPRSRGRGPLHRLAHHLATKARKHPAGWRVDSDGYPPMDPRGKRTPGPNAARALRVRIATRIGGQRVAEIKRAASCSETRRAMAAEIMAPPRPRGGWAPGWVGYRGALYDPTSPSFDWWHAWTITWREVALHHHYAAAGAYSPRR